MSEEKFLINIGVNVEVGDNGAEMSYFQEGIYNLTDLMDTVVEEKLSSDNSRSDTEDNIARFLKFVSLRSRLNPQRLYRVVIVKVPTGVIDVDAPLGQEMLKLCYSKGDVINPDQLINSAP